MIRKPCSKCGTVDVSKYKRENGLLRSECRKCTIEASLMARDKRRLENPELEKEKARNQMRAWRAKNKKKKNYKIYSPIKTPDKIKLKITSNWNTG